MTEHKYAFSGRLECISVLRIIGALGIALYHIGCFNHIIPTLQGGVHLFYCISGFLMMYTTQKKPKGSFVLKRLVRLIPLYWLMTLATFVAMKVLPGMALGEASLSELVKSMFFIPYLRPAMKSADVVRPMVGPAWTLYYDVYFALIFAVCMKLHHKYRGVMASGICLLLALFAGKFASATPFLHVVCQGWWLSFLAGIASFYAVRFFWGKDMPSAGRIAMCVLSAVAVVLLYALPLAAVRNAVFSFTAVSGLLLACRTLPMGKVIPSLGNVSYSFYLIHYYVIIAVGKFVNWSELTNQTVLGIVVVLVGSVVCAFISFYLIEQKFGTLFQKGIDRLYIKRNVTTI